MSSWCYRMSPRLVLRAGPEEQAEAGEQVILVQAGDAFPPGHPTTRLCLDLLKEMLTEGAIASLADVGCGAGVLSLAAAALEVPRVVGVDLAPAAARVTAGNARANGLAPAILALTGSTECLKGPFAVVAANLPWEVQLDKVPELARLASPHGCLLLSGFRDHQEAPLLERYRELGWFLMRRLVKYFHHPELPANLSFNWVAWRLKRTVQSSRLGPRRNTIFSS